MNELLEKYNDFMRLVGCQVKYNLAIVNFDANKIKSSLKSDYILFEERPQKEYNQMGIAHDVQTNRRYVETFFHEPTGKYMKGQQIVKVKSFQLFDQKGNIIVEDTF